MVKLGKAFSILVVFTLLILLAPAVMLAPGENVAQAQVCNNTKTIEANFTFNEIEPGEWWNFTAGSNGIVAEGLCLAQYTRENVVRSVGDPLPGCGFREYTNGTGNVVSTTLNLDGTMWVSWLTYNFSQKYSRTPLYHNYGEDAHFGWMAGRGHFYGGGDNNFTFVFALDFDSDADMTNADGKGFMLSMNETGSFAGHKIIGDFDVLIENGSDYTWNFHLRNYDPSEVFYLGVVDVVGQVLQEPTDKIRYGLDLLSFNVDGPQPTQTANHTTDFEEITWGREPMKNVTGGPMGAGGLMDLSRNNALYLHIDIATHPGETWVGIQGTPVCNLHIDDTYNQTTDDGSIYGHMWYLLLLDLPFQYLKMGTPPNYTYFNQTGYTFTPFGLTNVSTDWYSGRENYADAFIQIEATSGTAHQESTDDSYGLYPHPKVDKVFPKNGFPGTTMDVKIYGKYFLRAAGAKSGWVNNSGSVSFGPNITVNSYTIMNDSPIDNCIRANITIDPGVSGARVVNVTSCFGYSNGNGTTPYMSGLGNFSIVTTGSTLNGTVSFVGRGSAPSAKMIGSFDVKGFEPGNLAFEVWSGTATTNESGVFTMPGLLPETYDIAIKNCTCLSEVATNVTLNSTGMGNFGNREGDVKESDKVDFDDFLLLSGAYNARDVDPNWNPNADLNRSGKVDFDDFLLLSGNYNVRGAAYGHF